MLHLGVQYVTKARPGNSQKPERDNRGGKMDITKTAIAGTLESSDAQITVEPAEEGLKVSVSSTVMNQYGRQIRDCAYKTLEDLGVKTGRVYIVDKGALECTLKARIECAVFRSNDASAKNIPWGGAVK